MHARVTMTRISGSDDDAPSKAAEMQVNRILPKNGSMLVIITVIQITAYDFLLGHNIYGTKYLKWLALT